MTTTSPELRKRATAAASGKTTTPSSSSSSNLKAKAEAKSGIGFVEVVRIVAGVALLSSLASYFVTQQQSFIWGFQRPWWTRVARVKTWMHGEYVLTNEQLAAYDGSDPSKPILLALNRTIYDVSASPHIYGVGGMYSSLAAKDASRSYITTCFEPGVDLVPWFGGAEEAYVPLWLAKNPGKEELDGIAKGELAYGKDLREVIDTIQKSVGRKNTRLMREEAYAEARERVKAQVQTWENMFAKKDYPAVGRVVGVVEDDESLWKDLPLCKAALKQRPSIAESIEKAFEKIGRSKELNIGKMGRNMAKMAEKKAQTDAEEKAERKRAKREKRLAVEAELKKMREDMKKAKKSEGDIKQAEDEVNKHVAEDEQRMEQELNKKYAEKRAKEGAEETEEVPPSKKGAKEAVREDPDERQKEADANIDDLLKSGKFGGIDRQDM